jgi:hypothetical protein
MEVSMKKESKRVKARTHDRRTHEEFLRKGRK